MHLTPETSPARLPGGLSLWGSLYLFPPPSLCPGLPVCSLPRVFHAQATSQEERQGRALVSSQPREDITLGQVTQPLWHHSPRGGGGGGWASVSAGTGEGTRQEVEGGGCLKAEQARKQTLKGNTKKNEAYLCQGKRNWKKGGGNGRRPEAGAV